MPPTCVPGSGGAAACGVPGRYQRPWSGASLRSGGSRPRILMDDQPQESPASSHATAASSTVSLPERPPAPSSGTASSGSKAPVSSRPVASPVAATVSTNEAPSGKAKVLLPALKPRVGAPNDLAAGERRNAT